MKLRVTDTTIYIYIYIYIYLYIHSFIYKSSIIDIEHYLIILQIWSTIDSPRGLVITINHYNTIYIYIYIINIYISVITSWHPKNNGRGLFMYRIYEEFHVNLWAKTNKINQIKVVFLFVITYIYIYIYIKPAYCCNRVFANSLWDRGSVSGRPIPKIQKMVLDASLFNTQHYKVRIKGKWSNPWKGVVSFPTPWCSSYWKGSLQVTLQYGRPTYIYIYIYMYVYAFTEHSIWAGCDRRSIFQAVWQVLI